MNKQKLELLRVENLVKYFPLRSQIVHALDGVSLSINTGETFGLVGESGCGKSTLARLILRLIKPTAGQIFFEGENILEHSRLKMRRFRREAQIVFQDPFASLNPRMNIGHIIAEPLAVHNIGTPQERQRSVQELLEIVGLNPEHINRYPHEFSGGQCQRIGIARALASKPKLIVCDEPISALDVSIQAQMINFLKDIQREFGLTYLFVAHDLSVVKHMSDKVAVMYLGKIVELADSSELYQSPNHPYTQALLSAVPIPNPEKERRRQRIILKGEPPSPVNPPSGCRFQTRCPIAQEICRHKEPELRMIQAEHWVACHFARPNPISKD